MKSHLTCDNCGAVGWITKCANCGQEICDICAKYNEEVYVCESCVEED